MLRKASSSIAFASLMMAMSCCWSADVTIAAGVHAGAEVIPAAGSANTIASTGGADDTTVFAAGSQANIYALSEVRLLPGFHIKSGSSVRIAILPPARVAGVSPSNGSTLGGFPITLSGANLETTTQVIFGGVSAVITSVTATSVTALAPAHAGGLVDVRLVSSAGTVDVPSAFSYMVPQALDSIQGTVAAFGLHRLLSAFQGPLIQIRRSTDNAVAAWKPDETGWLSLSSLSPDGLPGNPTLRSWIAGGDGFVTAWYDQSGKGNHAVQTSVANQPGIIAGGMLSVKDGRPALSFDGVARRLQIPRVIDTAWTVIAVLSTTQSKIGGYWWGDAGFLGGDVNGSSDDFGLTFSDGYPGVGVGPSEARYHANQKVNDGLPRSIVWQRNGSNGTIGIFINGLKVDGPVEPATVSMDGGTKSAPRQLSIGSLADTGGGSSFSGLVHELIISNTGLSFNALSDIRKDHRASFGGNMANQTEVGMSSTQSVQDIMGDLSAGLSLRRISTSAYGPLVRIRRSSDGALATWAADQTGWLSLKSLSPDGIPGNPMLESWIGTADGFVAAWYDQSGQGGHAVQAIPGRQPLLLSHGAFLTNNGRPVMSFDGISQRLQIPRVIDTDWLVTSALATTQSAAGTYWWGDAGFLGGDVTGPVADFGLLFSQGFPGIGTGPLESRLLSRTSVNTGSATCVSWRRQYAGSWDQIYVNGKTTLLSGSSENGVKGAPAELSIGSMASGGGGTAFAGRIGELVIGVAPSDSAVSVWSGSQLEAFQIGQPANNLRTITVSQSAYWVNPSEYVTFGMLAWDLSGNQANAFLGLPFWCVSGKGNGITIGSTKTATFIAGAIPGIYRVSVIVGSVIGSASVRVNAPPVVAVAPVASPAVVSGTSTTLSVLGADDVLESTLKYRWIDPQVYDNAQGTNADKTFTAKFQHAGSVLRKCRITDEGGLTTETDTVLIKIQQTPTSFAIDGPSWRRAGVGSPLLFKATVRDQFGDPLVVQPSCTWTVSTDGGSISPTGLANESSAVLMAGQTPGRYLVTAQSNGWQSAPITVIVVNPGIRVDPNPVIGATATATFDSEIGLDAQLPGYETYRQGLRYKHQWSLLSGPAPVSISKYESSTGLTFSQVGTYAIKCVLMDPNGDTIAGSLAFPVNQSLASITVTPAQFRVNPGDAVNFGVVGRDVFGGVISPDPSVSWTVSGGGTIDANGRFVAGSVAGSAYRVTATKGAMTSTGWVIINAAPTIAAGGAAKVYPAVVTSQYASLYVTGTDDAPASQLTYTWSIASPQPGPVEFSQNGRIGSGFTSVTFHLPGTYVFTCLIVDTEGRSVSTSVSARVDPTVSKVVVTPGSIGVVPGGTVQFAAAASDQFGVPMSVPSTDISWRVLNGGSITAGTYRCDTASNLTKTIIATIKGCTGYADAFVLSQLPVPSVSLKPGLYATPIFVTVTDSQPQAQVHYTVDGSSPSLGSPLVSGPLFIEATKTLRVQAFQDNWLPSPVLDVPYTINSGNDLRVQVKLAGGGTSVTRGLPVACVATVTDAAGVTVPASIEWSANWNGWIDTAGVLRAGPGLGQIIVEAGATSTSGPTKGMTAVGYAKFESVNAAPYFLIDARCTPNPVTGTDAELEAVVGDDDTQAANDSDITRLPIYLWSATGPAPVRFISNTTFDHGGTSDDSTTVDGNGTASAGSLHALFAAPGNYTLTCLAADVDGGTVRQSIPVTVASTISSLAVSPVRAGVMLGASQAFTAICPDQFGANQAVQWNCSGGGKISANGLFTATALGGPYIITATCGSYQATATIQVTANPIPVIASVTTSRVVTIGPTVDLGVTATDDRGESALIYTWFASGPGAVTFSANGTNAAKTARATFAKLGSYTFIVEARDADGGRTRGTVDVLVRSGPVKGVITSQPTPLIPGQQASLSIEATDLEGRRWVPTDELMKWLPYEATFPNLPTFTAPSQVGAIPVSVLGAIQVPGHGANIGWELHNDIQVDNPPDSPRFFPAGSASGPSYAIRQGSRLVLQAILSDRDPGQKLTLSILNPPPHGVASWDEATGRMTYVPQAGFVGIDLVEFVSFDGYAFSSASTTLSVSVLPAVDPVPTQATQFIDSVFVDFQPRSGYIGSNDIAYSPRLSFRFDKNKYIEEKKKIPSVSAFTLMASTAKNAEGYPASLWASIPGIESPSGVWVAWGWRDPFPPSIRAGETMHFTISYDGLTNLPVDAVAPRIKVDSKIVSPKAGMIASTDVTNDGKVAIRFTASGYPQWVAGQVLVGLMVDGVYQADAGSVAPGNPICCAISPGSHAIALRANNGDLSPSVSIIVPGSVAVPSRTLPAPTGLTASYDADGRMAVAWDYAFSRLLEPVVFTVRRWRVDGSTIFDEQAWIVDGNREEPSANRRMTWADATVTPGLSYTYQIDVAFVASDPTAAVQPKASSAPVSAKADETIPTVSLSAPSGSVSIVYPGGSVELSATASWRGTGQLAFLINGAVIASRTTTGTLATTWSPARPGVYQAQAYVTDSQGHAVWSGAAIITVTEATPPTSPAPLVAVTAVRVTDGSRTGDRQMTIDGQDWALTKTRIFDVEVTTAIARGRITAGTVDVGGMTVALAATAGRQTVHVTVPDDGRFDIAASVTAVSTAGDVSASSATGDGTSCASDRVLVCSIPPRVTRCYVPSSTDASIATYVLPSGTETETKTWLLLNANPEDDAVFGNKQLRASRATAFFGRDDVRVAFAIDSLAGLSRQVSQQAVLVGDGRARLAGATMDADTDGRRLRLLSGSWRSVTDTPSVGGQTVSEAVRVRLTDACGNQTEVVSGGQPAAVARVLIDTVRPEIVHPTDATVGMLVDQVTYANPLQRVVQIGTVAWPDGAAKRQPALEGWDAGSPDGSALIPATAATRPTRPETRTVALLRTPRSIPRLTESTVWTWYDKYSFADYEYRLPWTVGTTLSYSAQDLAGNYSEYGQTDAKAKQYAVAWMPVQGESSPLRGAQDHAFSWNRLTPSTGVHTLVAGTGVGLYQASISCLPCHGVARRTYQNTYTLNPGVNWDQWSYEGLVHRSSGLNFDYKGYSQLQIYPAKTIPDLSSLRSALKKAQSGLLAAIVPPTADYGGRRQVAPAILTVDPSWKTTAGTATVSIRDDGLVNTRQLLAASPAPTLTPAPALKRLGGDLPLTTPAYSATTGYITGKLTTGRAAWSGAIRPGAWTLSYGIAGTTGTYHYSDPDGYDKTASDAPAYANTGYRFLNAVRVSPDVVATGNRVTIVIDANFVNDTWTWTDFNPTGDYVHIRAGTDGADLTIPAASAASATPESKQTKITIVGQRLVPWPEHPTLSQGLELDLDIGSAVPAALCHLDITCGAVKAYTDDLSTANNAGAPAGAHRMKEALKVFAPDIRPEIKPYAECLRKRAGTADEPVIVIESGGERTVNGCSLVGRDDGTQANQWTFTAKIDNPDAADTLSTYSWVWNTDGGQLAAGSLTGSGSDGKTITVKYPAGLHKPSLTVSRRWQERDEKGVLVSKGPELVGRAEIHAIAVYARGVDAAGWTIAPLADISAYGSRGKLKRYADEGIDVAVTALGDIRPQGGIRARLSPDGYPQNEYWVTSADSGDLPLSFTFAPTSERSVWVQGYGASSQAKNDLSVRVKPSKSFASDTTTAIFTSLGLEAGVDRDGDGTLRLRSTGDQAKPDLTSALRRYSFWLNDNADRGLGMDDIDGYVEEQDIEVAAGIARDNEDETLSLRRDLEDVARLWIRAGNRSLLPADATLRMHWRSVGTQTIRLFRSTDRTGGLAALTDYAKAVNLNGRSQILGNNDDSYARAIGKAGAGVDCSLPLTSTEYGTGMDGLVPLLFEGVKAGSGLLECQIISGGQVIARDAVWLTLRPVSDFINEYSLSTASNVPQGGDDPLSAASLLPHGEPFPGIQKVPTDSILEIHGWNMAYWEKRVFAATAFKRLWWNGYRGAFSALYWPVTWGFAGGFISSVTKPRSFDDGEFIAWRSGQGCADLLHVLKTRYPTARTHMYAHSMGNIVANEAVRQVAAADAPATYIAMQAALPGDLFDATLDQVGVYRFSYATYQNPEIPGDNGLVTGYGPNTANVYPFHFNGNVGPANMNKVNFANFRDYALCRDVWGVNQMFKPDSATFSLWSYGYGGASTDGPSLFADRFTRNIRLGVSLPIVQTLHWASTIAPNRTDNFLIMSYASESRVDALGRVADRSIGQYKSVDLTSEVWPSDKDADEYRRHRWHSAEFLMTLMEQGKFWKKAMIESGIASPVADLGTATGPSPSAGTSNKLNKKENE